MTESDRKILAFQCCLNKRWLSAAARQVGATIEDLKSRSIKKYGERIKRLEAKLGWLRTRLREEEFYEKFYS